MTYATGSATDLEDLLSKLDTFAQTTHGGWSSAYTPNPDTTNHWFELNKGSLSFSSRYLASPGIGDSISIHHATGSAGSGVEPGNHTADSGNGYNTAPGGTSANFESERCVRDIGNGPFPSYHFFADDTAPNDYIHIVVEATSGMYRHFGFGTLDKFGDNWVGGEYVYGHYMDIGTAAVATDANHQTLLDGLAATADRSRAATLRIASGLPNQGAAVWGVSAALAQGSLLTDTASNIRQQIHGGFRAGMEARGFANVSGNSASGVIPMYSIHAYYRDPNNVRAYLLGYMSDVRALNIRNFEAAEEVTVGSDTWVIFPLSIRTTAAVANRSLYSGIAYKKVT